MYISWLNEINAKDIDIAGGKGANLGEMTKAGFPVPPGFCVLSAAYEAQLNSNGQNKTIANTLKNLNTPADIKKAAGTIRNLVASLPVQPRIESEIRAAYKELSEKGYHRVAVRSSATAEDLPDASFAGQQETYLSISDADSLVASVRRCWASAWTERACNYRMKRGYDHGTLRLAVVVQAMVESETAGVLFTVNPMAPSEPAMLINASFGLGESVVSGKVSPDNFLVSKGSRFRILDKKAGSKEIMIRSLPSGNTETIAVPENRRASFCLTVRQLKSLKRLGLLVEKHYGKPQDIEWAIERNRLWLLQARPVTTFSGHSAAPKTKVSASIKKLIDSLKEHCPDAILPLEFDIILALQQQKHDIMSALGLKMPKANSMVTMDPDGSIKVLPLSARPAFKIILLPFTIKKLLATYTNEWARESLAPLLRRRETILNSNEPEMDDARLGSIIGELNKIIIAQCEIRFWAQLFPMMFIGKFLKLRLKFSGFSRDISETDLLGNLNYRSALIETELYDLAEIIASRPSVRRILSDSPFSEFLGTLKTLEEGKAIYNKFQDFLAKHGARTPKAFLPFSNLSWSESPAELVTSLGVIVRSDSAAAHEATMKASAARYSSLLTKMKKSFWGGKGFVRSLERYRTSFIEREQGLYEIETSFVALRSFAKEAGLRLVRAGVLDDANDIKFSRIDEMLEALNGNPPSGFRELTLRRKAGRGRAVAEWNSCETVLDGSAILSGVPSSAGIREGIAKLVRCPADFPKLQTGDILVCPYTDPTWTPLFSLAAAVIAETGGPLSHAAIVAREYSIPAVMGVSGALSILRDGQRIRVDGSRGEVHVL